MDSHTAKSDVRLLKARSELGIALKAYKNYVENFFAPLGLRVKRLRLSQARENLSSIVIDFCAAEGINIQPSPPNDPQSDGMAGRLVQEHWTRAFLILFVSKLPNSLWGEEIIHANWLRNRLPSSRIQDKLPTLAWSPSTRINYAPLNPFGQTGFAFVYRSSTVARKKVLPRSEFGNFVGVQGDERLKRIFIPSRNTIRTSETG